MNELLNQLQATLAEAEANNADAQKWRELVGLLGQLGYGPRISPDGVAEIVGILTEVARVLQQRLADSQEAPLPAAPKRRQPRRNLTEDDESQIHTFQRMGFTSAQIAEDLGVAKSSVEKFWIAEGDA